ncbi:hypothetical protein [Mycetohabitans rhizoxinica]|uniref:hypothetical protein n=1 Tax=Mycetohabitans rhizoxinica TaxID=412963 RepID=UPI0030D21999
MTVFDKGFLAAQLLGNLISGGKRRHFIIPGKSNTRWEALSGEPGDQIVRMRERLKQLPNEKRPGRSGTRAVKSRSFRYTFST